MTLCIFQTTYFSRFYFYIIQKIEIVALWFKTIEGFVAEIEWTKSESNDLIGDIHSLVYFSFMPKPRYKTTN